MEIKKAAPIMPFSPEFIANLWKGALKAHYRSYPLFTYYTISEVNFNKFC